MRSLLLLFFLFIFFAGCNSGTPEGVIPKKEMIAILTDMHLADGYTTAIADTQKALTIYSSVYKTHGIDSLKLRKSLEYYSSKPEMLEEIYTSVTKNLTSMQKQEQKKEQLLMKQREKEAKRVADSIKKAEKLRQDSVRKDSLKKALNKKLQLKKDSLRKDSLMKAPLKKEKKK